MLKRNLFPIFLMAVGGTLTSCIDKDYDLSDIDLTIGVQGDISLPFCSTGDVILRNIMNLEDDGVVQFVDDPAGGDRIFVVRQSGRTDIPPIHIDNIRFGNPGIAPFEKVVGLSSGGNSSSRPRRITVVIPEGGVDKTYEIDIVNSAYTYPVRDDDRVSFALQDVKASGISRDLVALEHVGLEENTITADLLSVDFGKADFFPYIHLDDATVTYPEGLHLTRVNFVYNGKDHAVAFDNATRTVTLFKGKSEAINYFQPIKMEFSFDGVTIGRDFTFVTGADGGEMEMKGEFCLNTTLRVESQEVDESLLKRHLDAIDDDVLLSMLDPQTQRIKLNLRDVDLIPDEVLVKGDGDFAGDLVASSVTGTVRREVEDPDPIVLDDLPDFLDDPEVVLDLSNPAIFLTIGNSLPGTVTTALKLTGSEERQTEAFDILHGENRYELSDHRGTLRPEGYEHATWLRVDDLGGLVRRLPEQIGVDIAPVTLKVDHLALPASHDFRLDYEIFAPLSCGPDFKLIYQSTERGWASDLEDLDKADAALIELNALGDNALPASVTLEVIPIDVYGHTVEALEPITLEMPAMTDGCTLKAQVKPREGYTLNDVITGRNGAQKFDGLRYRAVIDEPCDDAVLRETAKIRLHHIKATLKGGFVYDAN